MKSFLKNYIIYNIIIMFLFLFSTECIVRLIVLSNFWGAGVFRMFIITFLISIIWNLIILKTNITTSRFLNCIFVFFAGLIYFIEFGVYNFLGYFMGTSNSSQGEKVVHYFVDFLHSFNPKYLVIILPCLLLLIYYIFFEKKVIKKFSIERKDNYFKILTIIFIIVSLLFYLSIRFFDVKRDTQIESPYYLWLTQDNSNLVVDNFGVFAYFLLDFRTSIISVDDYIALNYLEIFDNYSENEEENNVYGLLDSYYLNKDETIDNEMTGVFKDKNVILILMESVNDIAILNEEYFPTLNMLYNDGIAFKNNFSPRNGCGTGNNEVSTLLSIYPLNSICSANIYDENEYFNSVFNVYKDNGYYTSAYHDFSLYYYNRDVYLKNMGVDLFMDADALNIKLDEEYENWPNDMELFKNSLNYYIDKDKFFTYLITVSPHLPYVGESNTGDLYKDKYVSLGYSETLSSYLSKLQILDEGLAYLIEQLKDKGKFEDTVLVLYGDHYPYGLNDAHINDFYAKNGREMIVDRNSKTNRDIDRTPVIIYNSEISPVIVEEYTTLVDILPTLLNLFDLDYDSRLYSGVDVFSDEHESRAVFADGSWQNENAFYNGLSGELTYYSDYRYTNDEIYSINKNILEMKKASSLVFKYDYFKYLDANLSINN